ncbi:lysophospholipid acyltransferase family protein [Flavimaricola marinus]|nr:lysophospholipid acyltransferase family protein [Flavimaricola marinus]
MTWDAKAVSAPVSLTWIGYLRAGLRAALLAGLIVLCLGILLLVRLIERPLFGDRRPMTPYITQFVCRSAFLIMGIRYRVKGQPMAQPGAVVANHSSWLDIFALNAAKRIYFVSKSEVAGWAGIGRLAKATGTIFINRDRREAKSQLAILQARLAAGHKLLFFPEGTSTDGRRVLAFKPTLFAAFLSDSLRDTLWIQPVTVAYSAPPGADPRAYGWWGGMDLAPHLIATLGASPQGAVDVIYHPPIQARDYPDRKALAAATEAMVRKGLEEAGIWPDEETA